MITKQETFQDTVVGADEELTFTIDTDSSVIFEVLRDKMYKDKIGAICREVASNSRDANREAKSDKPVEIEIISPNKLLSMGHLSISFKDYGKGIPPNKMADIYLKYGASDKRTTNELTGGFGLGAKTPFAYNDTFTVITIADYKEERRKYKYTAMLDTSGKGKMVLFSNELTDEETGTQIIVPINTTDDRYKFERDVLKYTKTWKDVVYRNFIYSAPIMEVAYEDEDVAIYKTKEYQANTMQLLIDGIPYPLDLHISGLAAVDTIGRVNSDYLTVLKFNTGELSISANRESVQYDEDTIKAINTKVEELHAKLDKISATHVNDQESYLDACVISYYITKASSNMANPPALTGAIIAHSKSVSKKLKNLTWNGIPTKISFDFKHHTLYQVSLKNGQNKYEPMRKFFFNHKNTEVLKSLLYYSDVRKNSSRNINLWNDGKEEFYLIKSDEADSRKGIEELQNFIFTFDIDFNLYSDLEVVKSARGAYTYQKKSYVTLNVRTGSNMKSTIKLDRKTFEPESGTDLSKVVYSTVSRLSRVGWASGRDEMRWLRHNTDYKTVVVREQDYDNWFSKTDMKHWTEVYRTEKDAYEARILAEKTEKVKEYYLHQTVKNVIKMGYIEEVRHLLPQSAKDVNTESEYVDSEARDIVKNTLKFNYKGLQSKIRRIFEEQYPTALIIMNSYEFDHNKRVQLLRDYLKTV